VNLQYNYYAAEVLGKPWTVETYKMQTDYLVLGAEIFPKQRKIHHHWAETIVGHVHAGLHACFRLLSPFFSLKLTQNELKSPITILVLFTFLGRNCVI
jgi:hypothetical protein